MAYIMITTRCNFSCEHCCMDATPKGSEEFGVDMSRRIFLKAIELFDGQYIALGGGEPTLHKRFWEFLGLSLRYAEGIWLATNGSQTETALALAALAKKGVVGVSLSLDDYHDPIDERVVKAFDKKPLYDMTKRLEDLREIRTVTQISQAGRAKTNGLWTKDDCCCDDIVVTPDGRIWSCGCREESLGDVFYPDEERLQSASDGKCYKTRKEGI